MLGVPECEQSFSKWYLISYYISMHYFSEYEQRMLVLSEFR
jgi:hypothetical protein